MNLNKINYLDKTISWIHDKLNGKQFLIFSGIAVGASAGLAAVILKLFVHFIRKYVLEGYLLTFDYKYIYLLMPLLGIGLTVFITNRFFSGNLFRGTIPILYAIAKKGSILPFGQIYSHIITSGITVGFGGSAGLESPIVSTGAAIGSNFGQRYKLTYKEKTLLLAAGAAGGIAGAFNAPIAGFLFALEVLIVDINITAIIPLLIAAASGTLISKIILEENILLYFRLIQPFDYHNVPYYILLGLLAGFVSLYHVVLFEKVEHYFSKITSGVKRCLYGGLALAALLALFPSLFGEGYDSIKSLAEMKPTALFKDSILSPFIGNQYLLLLLITITFLLKAFAVGITLGSGGNGGNFAPSLFIGAYLGFIFANVLILLGFNNVPFINLTLVAMAGILSGIFHAPLTAIFLIAEITGGYDLIIPLMIVSSVSFVVVKYFHPESIEVKKLKQQGAIVSGDKDMSLLGRINIRNLIEKDFEVIEPEEKLRMIIEHIKHSKRNRFPVLDKKGNLKGIIYVDSIKEEMFNPDLYDTIIAKELMVKPIAKIWIEDDIFSIMKKYDESGQWDLPVVENERYLGFLSKSIILSKYRNELLSSF
ncbi:chloride channel protein [Aurantibacillus circumpalustris]|uniref:chloride channel protein n=1 Tax=Aurantibacillus circumpalustris TaxID=3036359 RepID=UPI00295B4AC4|nr:chloride channel protein [Aurantibacillus circumpalustris]